MRENVPSGSSTDIESRATTKTTDTLDYPHTDVRFDALEP